MTTKAVWISYQVYTSSNTVNILAVHSDDNGPLPILQYYSAYIWERIDRNKYHAPAVGSELILERWEIQDV